MKYAEFFFPFEITMDQHESMQPVQELSEKLNERNIPCRVYIKPATAELNWHRWEVCKTSIYAKLVHAPNDTEDTRWCSQELKFLQIQGGTSKFPRVDRQEIGPVSDEGHGGLCGRVCQHAHRQPDQQPHTRASLTERGLSGRGGRLRHRLQRDHATAWWRTARTWRTTSSTGSERHSRHTRVQRAAHWAKDGPAGVVTEHVGRL